MKVEIKNIKNEKIEELDIPESLFNVVWNPDLVHQVLIAQQENARKNWAHTKDRGEVRGGGKKPWRQKGTGRARHGSIRSPLWIGGGVTFGPRNEKKYKQKVNKKAKKIAIFSVMSKKYADGEFVVIEDFNDKNIGQKKTKSMASFINSFVNKKMSLMFIFSNKNKDFYKNVRNIKKTHYLSPKSLNVKDLLTPKKIFIEKTAIEEIIKHYNLK